MTFIVAACGGLAVLLGLSGLVSPERCRALFAKATSQTRFVTAILIRLGMGAFGGFLVYVAV